MTYERPRDVKSGTVIEPVGHGIGGEFLADAANCSSTLRQRYLRCGQAKSLLRSSLSTATPYSGIRLQPEPMRSTDCSASAESSVMRIE
jgi:hypothetical protein